MIGSEQALTGGLQGAIDAQLTGAGQARGDIAGAGVAAQQQLGVGRQQTVDTALEANRMAQSGLGLGKQQVVDAALAANRMAQAGLGAGKQDVVGAKGSPLQLILSSIYHIDYPTGNISLREAAILQKHPRIAPLIEKSILFAGIVPLIVLV